MHASKQGQAASCLERGWPTPLTADIETGHLAFQDEMYTCVNHWHAKANLCFIVHSVDT